jgi:hypothetical protein
VGTGGPFAGGKVRPGRDADHSQPSSAVVKNGQLLFLSPLAPAWRIVGQLYISTVTHDNHIRIYTNIQCEVLKDPEGHVLLNSTHDNIVMFTADITSYQATNI